MSKPYVGIPIGDPAGIGPEIAVKACLNERVNEVSNPILIGNKNIIEHIIALYKLPLTVLSISDIKKARFDRGIINVFETGHFDMNHLSFGKIDRNCGKAAFSYIKKTVELALSQELDAIATTPIHKESLKLAGVPYIGHTEILADLSNTQDPLTMFQIDLERVFFLSRHVSLKKAIDLVKKERLMDYIKRSFDALKRLGVYGTLAVAGLNPHSGENGLFGSEEIEEIIPAIEKMRELGYDVIGPIPADSVFALGLTGRYAAILALYHDQGHIATKTYDFHRTISITNGMPFLRTSVDHGTAMDIAGKNMANESSMVEAIVLAAKYAPYFKLNTNQ